MELARLNWISKYKIESSKVNRISKNELVSGKKNRVSKCKIKSAKVDWSRNYKIESAKVNRFSKFKIDSATINPISKYEIESANTKSILEGRTECNPQFGNKKEAIPKWNKIGAKKNAKTTSRLNFKFAFARVTPNNIYSQAQVEHHSFTGDWERQKCHFN